ELDPLGIDAVRELADLVGAGAAEQVRARATSALRAAIASEPRSRELYDRLATVCEWSGDAQGEALARAASRVLAGGAAEPGHLAADPDGQLDEAGWAAVRDERSSGSAAALWSAIAPAVARTLPTEPGQLGFGRSDRVKDRDLARRYPRVARLV